MRMGSAVIRSSGGGSDEATHRKGPYKEVANLALYAIKFTLFPKPFAIRASLIALTAETSLIRNAMRVYCTVRAYFVHPSYLKGRPYARQPYIPIQ